jgi:hypothetical protein
MVKKAIESFKGSWRMVGMINPRYTDDIMIEASSSKRGRLNEAGGLIRID